MNAPETVELDYYIDRVEQLPPAPALIPELLRVLAHPNANSSRVVSLITYDPALTASLLRLCNSALLASARPVLDVEEAVVRLGFEQVYRVVAAASLAPLLRRTAAAKGSDPNQLWEHSVTAAVAAQLIARELGEDLNLVFTATLVHDIGKIVLSEALGQTYWDLVQEIEERAQCLMEAEKRVLGVEHAEIGGRLLERWRFPGELVRAVWFHHHPSQAAGAERLAACIFFGNLVAYLVGYGYGHHVLVLRGRVEALNILKLPPDSLPGYMMETYARFASIRTLFRIGELRRR
jgi:putative nucleotidyltransferase with HDIG domain